MKANSYRKFLGITTFGESHSSIIGVVIEDVKPGIDFPIDHIQELLEKRRPGKGKFASSRNEHDKIEILSGIFEGKTTGMPVCIVVYNKDAKSSDYEILKDVFRPGHADHSYFQKFKIYDYRGGGRASGRETIARVAASGFTKNILKDVNIGIYPVQIGKFKMQNPDWEFSNELHWYDKESYNKLVDYLTEIKQQGNSVGGIVKVEINNVPAGLGDPVFEKLDANLAKAIMSIGSVKGIEFGKGFSFAEMTGKDANDQINATGYLSNNNGGILGGISNGDKLEFKFVVKPTPSINKRQRTINKKGEEVNIKISGRHDVCIIPRIIPVAESMVKLVLADAIAYQKLVTGEERDINDLREAIDKIDEDILIALKRRMKISEIIGEYKKKHKIKIGDKSREEQIMKGLIKKADEWNLTEEMIRAIWQKILKESKKIQ